MRVFAAKARGVNELSNPLFPRKPGFNKMWLGLGAGLGILAVIIATFVVIYGPYFKLSEVEVVGTISLSTDELRESLASDLKRQRFLILPNNHAWFFDKTAATENLLSTFPLKHAELLVVGSKVTLTVEEDITMVVLRSGEEVYFIDPSGKVLRVAEPDEKAAVLVEIGAVPAPEAGQGGMATLQPGFPTIRQKVATTYVENDQVFRAEVVSGVIAYNAALRAIGLHPNEFVSDDASLPWFAITSDQEYLILFDATNDIDTQVAVLQAVTNEYLTAEETPRYVDVRFGSRVFIR